MIHEKNLIKKLFLLVGAHFTLSGNFLQPTGKKKSYNGHNNKMLLNNKLRHSINTPHGSVNASRSEISAINGDIIMQQLAILPMLIKQLQKDKAIVLIVDGGDFNYDKISRFFPSSKQKIAHCENFYSMSTGWINGGCSNWGALSKVAWNSFNLKNLCLALGGGYKDLWTLEAAKTFTGLYGAPVEKTLAPNSNAPNFHKKKYSKNNYAMRYTLGGGRLGYKYKPDCIFLINPTPSAITECRALDIPFWLLGIVSPRNNASFSNSSSSFSLKSNVDSIFLNYLIFYLIRNYN